ncbi:MAG: hypothetical protein ACI9ON_000342 [Limisphaerales bacterium]|jgi:hypothetical protein
MESKNESYPGESTLVESNGRSHRRRKQGVEYKLRVIKDSGGKLELVEVEPPEHWFVECSRIMQLTGWGI